MSRYTPLVKKERILEIYRGLASISKDRGFEIWFENWRGSGKAYLYIVLMDAKQNPVVGEKGREPIKYRVTKRALEWLESEDREHKNQAINCTYHLIIGIRDENSAKDKPATGSVSLLPLLKKGGEG